MNQQNDELHELCFDALVKASAVLDDLELSALCHMAGIASKDVLEAVKSPKESFVHFSNYVELGSWNDKK